MFDEDRLPPADVLKDLFRYEPETGDLYWRRPSYKQTSGPLRGADKRKTCYQVFVFGKNRKVHRVIAKMLKGAPLVGEVDHRDNNPLNNRPENLREATSAQQKWNTRARSGSRSGVKGVYWDNQTQRWRSIVTVNGRRLELGRFRTVEEASAAYSAKASALHGEFFNAATTH